MTWSRRPASQGPEPARFSPGAPGLTAAPIREGEGAGPCRDTALAMGAAVSLCPRLGPGPGHGARWSRGCGAALGAPPAVPLGAPQGAPGGGAPLRRPRPRLRRARHAALGKWRRLRRLGLPERPWDLFLVGTTARSGSGRGMRRPWDLFQVETASRSGSGRSSAQLCLMDVPCGTFRLGWGLWRAWISNVYEDVQCSPWLPSPALRQGGGGWVKVLGWAGPGPGWAQPALSPSIVWWQVPLMALSGQRGCSNLCLLLCSSGWKRAFFGLSLELCCFHFPLSSPSSVHSTGQSVPKARGSREGRVAPAWDGEASPVGCVGLCCAPWGC